MGARDCFPFKRSISVDSVLFLVIAIIIIITMNTTTPRLMNINDRWAPTLEIITVQDLKLEMHLALTAITPVSLKH